MLGFHLGRGKALLSGLHPFPELLLHLLLPELPELSLVSGITLHGVSQTAANQVNHNGRGLKKHTNRLLFSKAGVEATKATLEGAKEEREGT